MPYAVSVVSALDLRAAGPGVNLSEVLARVPGITASNRSNYAQDLQINSRGFGARASFGVRGLRLYSDGIPASGPDGQGQVSHFDLAGAQRVEVLRGPFTALFGSSSLNSVASWAARVLLGANTIAGRPMRAMTLAMVPEGRNIAASLPISAAIRSVILSAAPNCANARRLPSWASAAAR